MELRELLEIDLENGRAKERERGSESKQARENT